MINIRNIRDNDHAILRNLAINCPPLDIHTQYTYWVNAAYFGDSSFMLLEDDKPIGYIMAIDTPNYVFIWQIGILPEYRNKGLSKLLIDSCVKYSNKVGKSIQVTIADENKASYNAFYSYFKNIGKEFKKIDQIKVTDLNDESFLEEENRYEVSFN